MAVTQNLGWAQSSSWIISQNDQHYFPYLTVIYLTFKLNTYPVYIGLILIAVGPR